MRGPQLCFGCPALRTGVRRGLEILLYALVGVAAGGASAAMTVTARAYAMLVTSLAAGKAVSDVSYLSYTTPAIALLAGLSSLIALALALAAPEAMGASIDELLDEYHHRAAEASLRGVAVKVVAAPIAVGGGAPVGIIGPLVYVGGSVGGIVGRFLKMGFGLRRRLFIAGIAGAVSWALRAPLGAVFFSLEIPYHRDLEGGADSAVASAVGSFSSFLASVVFAGAPTTAFTIPREHSAGYIAGVLLVSVLAGLVGRAFSRIYRLGVSLRRSRVLAASVIPLMTSASALAGPLFAGSGSGIVDLALSGAALPASVALLVLAVRLGFSPLLSGMGLPGGLFGPGIAAGALLGLSVHSLTGLADPVSLAVVGMASFYGSASTTPIGMSVIAAEVSGNYFLIVPTLIASLIAREVVGNDYLYVNQKERRLRRALALARDLAEALKGAGVAGLKAECTGPESPTISVDVLDPDVVAAAVEEVPTVVLVGSSVAGLVTEESLGRYLLGGGEVIERVPFVGCGESLFRVVELMVKHNSPYVILAGRGYRVLLVREVLREMGLSSKTGISRGRVGKQKLSGRRSPPPLT